LRKSRTPRETADPNQLLDIGQAAAFLNVSETSLRRWTNSGRLRCLRVGQRRERRFRHGDLVGFLEPSEINAAAGDGRRAGLGDLSAAPVTLAHGSHLCGLYASDPGRIKLTVPFLHDGLKEGSVCFLVAPIRIRNETLKSLMKKRASLQGDIHAGRLILSDYHATSHAQVGYFRRLMDKRASEGVQSFRVLGEMWGMRSKASAASLAEYEAAYDRHIARKYPVVTICLYDGRKYSGVEVVNALEGHPDTFRYPLEKSLA
jgi:excisionase family DNA binding protein